MVNVVKTPRSALDRKPGGAMVPSRSGSTQNMAANIKVVVRVRPPNAREVDQNHRFVVDIIDDKMLIFDPKEEQRPFFYQGVQQPKRNCMQRANKELKFVFDHVCGMEATNQDVFETTTKDILASLMEGYNCSVFVYGATGAGKTFTMIGTQQSPGITYLTMDHLFYTINSMEKDREFKIGVSYIEVYNENVYDLLKRSKQALNLREDPNYGVMIAGLTLHNIKTAQELLDMLEDGNKNRTQHPTDANAESSRSHAVFQVYITMRYKTSSQVRMVKLSMIDLAGSERASATGCVGERFKEGANINRSLLSLGNCINKLADGVKYIPYRDSKLTRLLKDSLGGNCKTVMIANVSPSSGCFDDTYNTLKYAARANKIQLSIKKNIVDGDVRTSQYVRLNEELKKKVKELEAKLTLSSVQPAIRPPPAAQHEKALIDCRRSITEADRLHAALESRLLALMSRARVLALREWLRTRAFTHIVELAHRSSTEAMDQVCTEDIPRRERAAESYMKQSVTLDTQIQAISTKCQDAHKRLQTLCSQATADHPQLADFVSLVTLQSKMRQSEAKNHLQRKLLYIQNDEINTYNDYVCDMSNMQKKLYLTLKGYDLAPPALTEEYLEIMKKAKSAKGITWCDDSDSDTLDAHFKFICSLDLSKPSSIPDCASDRRALNATVDVVTDSEDLTDVEYKEPKVPTKRSGTPIRLANNDTIVIDDSFEALDSTRTTSSAKKVKREIHSVADDIENYAASVDPQQLNSTFVLPNSIKTELLKVEEKRGLTDRTNTMQRSVQIADKARIVKPVVGRALPFRRPLAAAAPGSSRPGPRAPGFGSSLARDGTPLLTVQVRARERSQNHPYIRPAALNTRR